MVRNTSGSTTKFVALDVQTGDYESMKTSGRLAAACPRSGNGGLAQSDRATGGVPSEAGGVVEETGLSFKAFQPRTALIDTEWEEAGPRIWKRLLRIQIDFLP